MPRKVLSRLNRFLKTPLVILLIMKTFEDLFAELQEKAQRGDPSSGTVQALAKGKHFIGKKIVEEAAEVWMACEHESREAAAEEISQLLYHLQVMMLANDLTLEEVYAKL